MKAAPFGTRSALILGVIALAASACESRPATGPRDAGALDAADAPDATLTDASHDVIRDSGLPDAPLGPFRCLSGSTTDCPEAIPCCCEEGEDTVCDECPSPDLPNLACIEAPAPNLVVPADCVDGAEECSEPTPYCCSAGPDAVAGCAPRRLYGWHCVGPL